MDVCRLQCFLKLWLPLESNEGDVEDGMRAVADTRITVCEWEQVALWDLWLWCCLNNKSAC